MNWSTSSASTAATCGFRSARSMCGPESRSISIVRATRSPRPTSWPAAHSPPDSRRWRSTEYYWDGGIMSNTPLQYVCEDFRISALVVAVDLFSGKGELPQNLDQAMERAKDIQYQSKQRLTDGLIRKIEA